MTDIFESAAPSVAIDPEHKYVAIVEQAFQDHLVSSPASQAGSEVWATIQNFIVDLKKRIQEV